MQFPIHIELRRSRILVVLLILFHVLAGVSVAMLPWAWLLLSVLLAALVLSAGLAMRPSNVIGLRLSADGGLECLFGNDQRTAAVVLPDSVVFNQLIILRLRIGDARRASNLALLPDSMSAEQHRMLRLWLRWRGAPASAPSARGV